MERIGIDIGGVIIDRANDGTDTSFFSNNYLLRFCQLFSWLFRLWSFYGLNLSFFFFFILLRFSWPINKSSIRSYYSYLPLCLLFNLLCPDLRI